MENVDIHQPDDADINQSQSTRFSVHQAKMLRLLAALMSVGKLMAK